MFKKIITGGIIVSAMMFGDYINVLDKTIYPLKYNQKIDEQSYQRPFKLKKRYVINKDDYLEVHIGYGNQWAKVKRNLVTTDRKLEEILIEKGKEIQESFTKWYQKNF